MANANQSLLESLLNDSSFKNWVNKDNENDVIFWESWLKNNPDKITIAHTARDIITGISFTPPSLSEEKIHNELEAVLGQITSEENEKDIPTKIITMQQFKKYMAVAAVSLLFIFLGNLFFNNSTQISHKTAYGEIIDLKLSDGTTVVLNGNSEINYDSKNPRNIELIGEAYFKVTSIPSTKAKFWVNTNDLKVTVYGTQFHVSTREEKTAVVLDEGTIHLVLNDGSTAEMQPGEFVSYSKNENTLTRTNVSDKEPFALWRKGTYVFNNTSLQNVLKNIEKTYGVEVKFIDKGIAHQLLTGGIPNENLKICLSAIEKSTGIRIVKKGNKLLVYKH